jgi:hypothetical protein
MIYDLYNALKTSDLITSKVSEIKFFEFPDTDKVKGIHIIINPVTPPEPTDYADKTYTALEQIFQVDVWSLNYDDTASIAGEVTRVLYKELRAPQNDGMTPEYDSDTGIHRDARRYRFKKPII